MTALASITQDWYNVTDSGSLYNSVHVVFVDFRKALDMVDHGVPLTKLAGMGITRSFWKWTQAYSGTLTRREIVRANASLGELRRDKEKLSSPISCEFVRVKAS